ncbi:MAG: MBL fold metallo-hydrolase [Geodermatophilaceae bacterium]|nr:MBL fold metallo-hydrolase [Geodermatophilaceae bacterium]
MGATIERVVTAGVFSLDGEDFDVENNVWLVGDEFEVLVIDAGHNAKPILKAIGGRDVLGIVLTHGHNDHLNAAGDLWDGTRALIYLHPADRMLWDVVYPDVHPDRDIADGDTFTVAGTTLRVIATPGHSPGSVCLYAEDLGTVFTGDTLFHGGPGATGRSFSDHPTILASITEKLLTLPRDTIVKTGHGEDSTIGAEAANLT